jgi:metallo-beta-lactamase family protein
MSIELQFLGAARHVTGTKHLLSINDKKVLLECGLVQGPRKAADRANRNLPVDGGDVDALVLSHAHIDYCRAISRSVKSGYAGPIYCTDATADMLEMMLLDSAHIQAQDAKYSTISRQFGSLERLMMCIARFGQCMVRMILLRLMRRGCDLLGLVR